MNNDSARQSAGLAYVLGIVGTFLIVTLLVWFMHRYTQPAPLGAQRAGERAKALSELRAAEHEALTTTAWLDQPKGIVRLRIEDAMKLVELQWKNPGAARSNLVARAEKAAATPPPAAQPASPFE